MSEPHSDPWEQPLGAVPGRRRPARVPRSGRPRARARVEVARGAPARALEPAGHGVFAATVPAAAGRRLRVPSSTASGAARPVLALAARGHPRARRGCRPGRVRLDRRRRAGRRPLRDARDLRAARRHVHAEGTFDGGDRAPGAPARARRHRDRADAGRRLPRRARLGLRRRLPLGRALGLRRPARASHASSTPPTRRASR